VARERILITGAAGVIGRSIVPLLREDFALRLLDKRRMRGEGDDEIVRADIRRFKSLVGTCRGVSAVLHLAAIPREGHVDALMSTNAAGTYNVFEAANQAGVRKVVFASTVQTARGYSPETVVAPDMPVRPVTMYACTKVFGEALARFYADQRGMSMICLRIGWFDPYDGRSLQSQPEMLRSWCSPRDLAQLVTKSIRTDLSFAIFFAVSKNPIPRWDTNNAQEIVGYSPVDSAADYVTRTAISGARVMALAKGWDPQRADNRLSIDRNTTERTQSYRPDEALLRAVLLNGTPAKRAWEQLEHHVDFDGVSKQGFFWAMPLLYRTIQKLKPDHPRLATLKGIYKQTWYINQLLLDSISPLLKALQNASIATMVLNEAAVTSQYYKDFGLRSIRRFDVLVRPQDARAAVAMAREAGWRPRGPGARMAQSGRLDMYSAVFVNTRGQLFKLKWQLNRDTLPALGPSGHDQYWQGAVPLHFGGLRMMTLNASDQLLHVCIDGARSQRTGPWIVDAMMILNDADSPIDWDRFVRQTETVRAIPHVCATLQYLCDVLDAPVPADVLDQVRALPLTRRERVAYWLNTVWPERMLARYALVSSRWSLPRTLIRFPSYVQDDVLLDYQWQVPLWAARQLLRNVLTRLNSYHPATQRGRLE
jgi:uronate dehydrogenase